MRRIEVPGESREDCLRRAAEYLWQANHAPNPGAAAWAWDQARLWRSRSYLAKPADRQVTP